MVAVAATSGCATAFTGFGTTISTDSAIVSGKVINDTGVMIEYWAQYGLTNAYGSETEHEFITTGGHELLTVFPTIKGLQRATTYHFRVCAQDEHQSGGPRCGEDATFRTQSYGCGETVTTDVKLTGDLDCSFNAGFVVGAGGIDINLAGHSMLGGIFSGGGGPIGIDNNGGYDDVTVRNGSLAGFGFGVELSGADRNRILGITSSAAGNAVTIQGGEGSEIRRSDLFGRSYGIRATGSNGLTLADTSTSGAFGDGLSISGDRARIVRNRFPRNGGAFPVASGLELTGSGARIAYNRVDGAWSEGGIVATGANNLLVGNQVFDAAATGMPDPPPQVGDGIFIGSFSTGVTLRGNRAERNAGDGIDVRAAGVSLEDNAGFNNGGWGILAVPGVTDLGGNTAGGNTAGQCLNVFCP